MDNSSEFYHDKGGFDDPKQGILMQQNNICGKVTRELVKEVEVYSIKDYGAVEIGLHKFTTIRNQQERPQASKFIIMWQHKILNGLLQRSLVQTLTNKSCLHKRQLFIYNHQFTFHTSLKVLLS
jgi:hypothetical protein